MICSKMKLVSDKEWNEREDEELVAGVDENDAEHDVGGLRNGRYAQRRQLRW